MIMEIPNQFLEIPIAYLIPTKNGKGICSSALVDFLVTTHNSFIEFYYSKLDVK